jgi:hypothetical protein
MRLHNIACLRNGPCFSRFQETWTIDSLTRGMRTHAARNQYMPGCGVAASSTACSLYEKPGMQATLTLISCKQSMQWDNRSPRPPNSLFRAKLVVHRFGILLVCRNRIPLASIC